MPELKCVVTSCTFNQDKLCHLDAIEVGGNNASDSHETSCNSFQQRAGEAQTNTTRIPSERCSIDCQATQCSYNERERCHADNISVEGSSASHVSETACATFTCEG